MRKLLLSAVLCFLFALPISAEDKTTPGPKAAAPCIIAATCIVIGGIVIYHLVKLCDRYIPPAQVQPPLPPGQTNAPNYRFTVQQSENLSTWADAYVVNVYTGSDGKVLNIITDAAGAVLSTNTSAIVAGQFQNTINAGPMVKSSLFFRSR